MKFYISTTGIKRVTISSLVMSSKAKGSGSSRRRVTYRSVLLVLGIFLPFLFVRIAFLALESAAACSSSADCMRWRFIGGNDASQLGEELEKALSEASKDESDDRGKESSLETFKDLVKDMTTNKQDIKAFAFKTKAMMLNMEHKVQSARKRELVYWHRASHGVPKILHCLCLKLAEEYAVNAMARSRLPPPEYVSRLTDPSFYHLILFTDNVLAASVAVSSTIQSSIHPEKLVFHIVTDKKTYTPMHAWFALNAIKSAVVEVKGLHHFDWSWEVNVGVKEMLQIHRLIWSHYFENLGKDDFEHEEGHMKDLDALSPSSLSLMNHLRVYLPELFPDLDKVVFLDDDIVVQHDLSSLWEIDLKGKVVGAVVNSSWCGDDCCQGRKYSDYFNFTNPLISSKLDPDHCGWLYGVNIFDLQAWRKNTITKTYLQWLKLNLNSGLGLWYPGILPPSLIAFEGHVHPIDPSFQIAGLGHKSPDSSTEKLEQATVLHFSGPAKPWLEIGIPEVRSLWSRHVNISNKFIRQCIIMG